MDKTTTLNLIKAHRIVAVIRLDDLSQAERLCQALFAGGIYLVEFTLTNPDAYAVVKNLRSKLSLFDAGEAAIGIGSLRNAEQVQGAVNAGAQFLVSPILFQEMIEIGAQANLVTTPGAYSPTEIAAAHEAGADMVKVFPANVLGPKYIKALLAPMPDLQLMPTGGINLDNLEDYLNVGASAVGVGSALVTQKLIANRDWKQIESIARLYSNLIGTAYVK